MEIYLYFLQHRTGTAVIFPDNSSINTGDNHLWANPKLPDTSESTQKIRSDLSMKLGKYC